VVTWQDNVEERISLSYYSEDSSEEVTLRSRVFGSCVWQNDEEMEEAHTAMSEALRAGKTHTITKQKHRVKTDRDLARWHAMQFTPT
jgi:hypothetical protein